MMRWFLLVATVALLAAPALPFQCRSLPVHHRVAPRRNGVASLMAKKGKPNVPIQQRGGFVSNQRMQDQMAQMKPEADGYPVFNLYVQTPRANMWYPCGSMKGDSRAKQLVEGWVANSLGMGGMVKGNIDRSVASSIFTGGNDKNLVDQVCQMYPALKPAKNDLQFGYKVVFEGLEDSVGKQEIQVLTPDMKEGPLDKLKSAFGME